MGDGKTIGRLVVWGAGELGGRVAAGWAKRGEALGLTKSETRHAALRAQGVTARIGSAAGVIRPDDALLLALPGHVTQRAALEEIVDVPAPKRAVLISSTGYYGGVSGRIDERTPAGSSKRAQAIAETERVFLAWAGENGVVLRLGGLYRPGRGPFSALARKKVAPARPPERKLALIHYDDAAAAALAALRHEAPEQVYLGVVTPCPTRREFYTAACAQLRLPPPHFSPVDTAFEMVFDNSRLRRDLLPQPAFPKWQAALA